MTHGCQNNPDSYVLNQFLHSCYPLQNGKYNLCHTGWIDVVQKYQLAHQHKMKSLVIVLILCNFQWSF